MESAYKGSMEAMSVTFSGLTSTLEDTMTEIDNARGEGYNAERSGGLQAEIDAYGGALGQAVESLNAIGGQNEAYLENLSGQYTREALSAVLLGETPSGIYGPEQQEEAGRHAGGVPGGQRGVCVRQPGGGAQDGQPAAGGGGPGQDSL